MAHLGQMYSSRGQILQFCEPGDPVLLRLRLADIVLTTKTPSIQRSRRREVFQENLPWTS